jgi:hypothetical protein
MNYKIEEFEYWEASICAETSSRQTHVCKENFVSREIALEWANEMARKLIDVNFMVSSPRIAKQTVRYFVTDSMGKEDEPILL